MALIRQEQFGSRRTLTALGVKYVWCIRFKRDYTNKIHYFGRTESNHPILPPAMEDSWYYFGCLYPASVMMWKMQGWL